MSSSKIDLLTGSPWKKIIAFVIPLFLGNLVQQFYNTVDTVVAGRFIGPEALAAVGANAPIIQIAIALFFGISMGTNVLVAQNYGAKNTNELRHIVDTFMIFIYIASIALTITGLIFIDNLYQILKTPKEITPMSKSYMQIMLIGMVTMFGYNGVSAMLRGIGDTKTPLMFLFISSLLNVALDILFVTIIHLGVAGLALATVFAQTMSFIFCVVYLNKQHPVIGIHFRHARFRTRILKDIVIIGVPISLQGMFIGVSMFVLQSLVNTFGYITMAGYNAATKIEAIAILPGQNFGMAASAFIGQNIGAGKWDRVKIGIRSAVIMTCIASIIISLAIVVFDKYWLAIFTKNYDVISVGKQYILTVAPFYLAAGYLFTMVYSVRGSGATLIPMVISILGQVFLRIPLAYLFVSIFKTPFGIWLAIPMSWLSSSLLITIYYKSGKWKKHVKVKSKEKDNAILDINM